MATTEEIRIGIAEIVHDISGRDMADVQLDKSFSADLDIDSLEMLEIVYAAEEKFAISIPDDQSKDLKTVADVVSFIETALA